MEDKRPPPPLLNLSRLKAAATRTGGAPAMTRGDNATTSSSAIGARGAATSSSSSTTTTHFDARRELAADLQRREAKRAQARAEAADQELELIADGHAQVFSAPPFSRSIGFR